MDTATTATGWSFTAPVNPTVPAEELESFLQGAPRGTVISHDGDLYQRAVRGNWIHLNELVYAGSGYYSYQEHNDSTPQELFQLIGSYSAAEVLRIGAGIDG